MADGTHIEWTDATWNPITGCSIVSPGCTNCYAMKLAGTRLKHTPSRQGLTIDTKAGPVWNGEVRLNEQWIDQPLRWRRPRRIFVCAHGDLFAEGVPDAWIDKVFAVMALGPQHTFQVLTKRAKRMREYVGNLPNRDDIVGKAAAHIWGGVDPDGVFETAMRVVRMPLPNVWLGISAEDQARADERIPELLQTPAAVRFISAEPLLGPIDLGAIVRAATLTGKLAHDGKTHPIEWVIVGGESGPSARPMHPDWARLLRDQCIAAGVAFFFKQWGAWLPGENKMLQRPVEPATWQDGEIGRHSLARDDREYPEWRHYDKRGEPGAFGIRVGKKRAGRLLDGRTHDGFPEVKAA